MVSGKMSYKRKDSADEGEQDSGDLSITDTHAVSNKPSFHELTKVMMKRYAYQESA